MGISTITGRIFPPDEIGRGGYGFLAQKVATKVALIKAALFRERR